MGTVPLAGGIESSEERLLDCGQQSSVVGGDGVGQGSFLLRAKTGWPPPSPGSNLAGGDIGCIWMCNFS